MIHFDNEEHGRLVMSSAMGGRFSPVTMKVISRSHHGEYRGGVVYENWTGPGGSVIVHIGSTDKKWINRDMLWVMFHYPFVQMDVDRAFAQVASKNEDCLSFCASVGWEVLHRIEGVFPDDDMILLRLLRSHCRFLDIKPKNLRYNRD